MIYIFNELSLDRVESLEIARKKLNLFVLSISHARELGFDELRLHEKILSSIFDIYLFENYRVDSWLTDQMVDGDLKDRFREIITSTPLLSEKEIKENDIYEQSSFSKDFGGQLREALGLGAAYSYHTLSISLSTNEEWDRNAVSISHYYINEDYTETIKDVSVMHFSNIETLSSHIDWWTNYQVDSLKKSKELWERRNEFFPNLELCEEVEKQLEKIGISKTLFQIIDRLKELDSYAVTWADGNFSYEDANQNTSLKISPESDSTLRKFGVSRKFTISGQGKKVFDLHIKTGDLRIHFYPDNTNKKIYVGYIGKHLRIASEN